MSDVGCNTTHSPLVEPDMKISLIRLSRRLRFDHRSLPCLALSLSSRLKRETFPKSLPHSPFGCVQPGFSSSVVGLFSKRFSPSLHISTSTLRPLCSTVVTRFSATIGLSDSRQEPAPGYLFPLAVCAPVGLPGSSPDLSTRAAPFHPEQPGDCFYPLLDRRFWLHLIRQTGHCYLV